MLLLSSNSIPDLASPVESVLFDGTNNDEYIAIPINGGESANVANQDFTIEIWVRPTSANNNTAINAYDGNLIIDADNYSGNGGAFLFGINDNTIDVGVRAEGTAGYTTYGCSATVNDNAWHWLVMTYDISARQMQFYIDGTRELNETIPDNGGNGNLHWTSGGSTADQQLVLGREKGEFNPDGGFHGRISEMRISPSVLYSAASITQPSAPLDGSGADVAYYGFTEGSGSTVNDTGGGTNGDGTITLASWDTDGPY